MGSNYAVAKRPTRGKRLSAGGEPHREPGKWVFTSVNTTRVRTALKSNQSAERPAEWRQPSPADMDCRCSTCRSRGRTTLCSVQSKRFQAQSHADARSTSGFLDRSRVAYTIAVRHREIPADGVDHRSDDSFQVRSDRPTCFEYRTPQVAERLYAIGDQGNDERDRAVAFRSFSADGLAPRNPPQLQLSKGI